MHSPFPRDDSRLVRGEDICFASEIESIVRLAGRRRPHVVRVGQLTLLSTPDGDAWLLDTDDRLARPLARDGEPIRARVLENDRRFVIEWTHDFAVTDGELRVRKRTTGARGRLTWSQPLDLLGIG